MWGHLGAILGPSWGIGDGPLQTPYHIQNSVPGFGFFGALGALGAFRSFSGLLELLELLFQTAIASRPRPPPRPPGLLPGRLAASQATMAAALAAQASQDPTHASQA